MDDGREWKIGAPIAGDFGPASTDPSERARQRAEARDRRAQERLAMAQARSERRGAEREQAARERQAAREARRLEEAERMRALRPAPAADGAAVPVSPRRRKSGGIARTGEARIVRDTRHYSTRVDAERIRELAARGTSVSGLAAVFGLSAEEVAAALAGGGAGDED